MGLLGLGPSFWAPFIIQVVLGGALSAVVGYIAVRFVKRIGREMFGEQQRTTTAAEAAASRAGEALDASQQAARHATTASEDAKVAGANSKQATARLDVVGLRLVDVLNENRGMADRLDRLLTAYVRLRTIARQQGVQLPADLDPPDVELENTQALTTITGRHLLHAEQSS